MGLLRHEDPELGEVRSERQALLAIEKWSIAHFRESRLPAAHADLGRATSGKVLRRKRAAKVFHSGHFSRD